MSASYRSQSSQTKEKLNDVSVSCLRNEAGWKFVVITRVLDSLRVWEGFISSCTEVKTVRSFSVSTKRSYRDRLHLYCLCPRLANKEAKMWTRRLEAESRLLSVEVAGELMKKGSESGMLVQSVRGDSL